MRSIYKIFFANKVVWFLTMSDVFTWGLFLIINALIGVYLENRLDMKVESIIGVGIALSYAARAASQIPIGMLADRTKSDRDDIFFLFLGNLFMGITFLCYPIIENKYHYFGLQILFGLGSALNLVNWRKLFARNLDLDKEGLEYGAYDTIMSLFMIVFSVGAGYVASLSEHYFDLVMITIGVLMITSTLWPAMIFREKNRRSI